MIPEYPEKVTFRMASEERQKAIALIEEGKFKSISEVIRAALNEFLSKKVSQHG